MGRTGNLPRRNNIDQVKVADDSKDEADEDFKPYHPDESASENTPSVAVPNPHALPDGLPCGKPAEADGESPKDRCQPSIFRGHLLRHVVRR